MSHSSPETLGAPDAPIGKHMRMLIERLVPLGETPPVTIALHSLASETRQVSGCIRCTVAADIGSRGTVRYTEDWLTEDDLRERVRSDSFNQLVTLIEDSSQPPHIEFTLAHETRGLDFVEEVRASSD